jgi:hypothetical protein
LARFARTVFSQSGEDGILEYVFSKIQAQSRWCVEFGAWDGRHLSNCANLLNHHGWNGVLIEGHPRRFKALASNYSQNRQVICLDRLVQCSGPDRLDEILGSLACPAEFDLLSIDIDGMDYFVWESLVQFRPRLVVIEFNPTVPNDVIFVQAKDSGVNQGCSLLALVLLAKAKGYELIASTGFNAFFVTRDEYWKLSIESNHISNIHAPPHDGRIFQGFDSTIFVTGMERLIWSDVTLTQEDFQVLPQAARRFKDALDPAKKN